MKQLSLFLHRKFAYLHQLECAAPWLVCPDCAKEAPPLGAIAIRIPGPGSDQALTNEVIQAVASVLNIGCNCLDKEPRPFRINPGLGHAGFYSMPQNPWVDLMTTLHTSSDVPIKTISIQPRYQYKYLRFPAFDAWIPYNFHASASVLLRLMTKLELCLRGGMPINSWRAHRNVSGGTSHQRSFP